MHIYALSQNSSDVNTRPTEQYNSVSYPVLDRLSYDPTYPQHEICINLLESLMWGILGPKAGTLTGNIWVTEGRCLKALNFLQESSISIFLYKVYLVTHENRF